MKIGGGFAALTPEYSGKGYTVNPITFTKEDMRVAKNINLALALSQLVSLVFYENIFHIIYSTLSFDNA